MRLLLVTLAFLLGAMPALAHVGHLAEVAGHGHWLGAAALGAAIALGVWGARKGAKPEDADTEDEIAEEGEPEEAPA